MYEFKFQQGTVNPEPQNGYEYMNLGIDELISNLVLRSSLKGSRVALLAHPASVTGKCSFSIDVLMECSEVQLVAAFGPQHGMRGEKQDNMIETDDYFALVTIFRFLASMPR